MSDISAERKKELKRAYAERKPDMGVFCIRCDATNDHFLGICHDYTADVNSHFARLGSFLHPSKDLLALYRTYGRNAFTASLSERLDYIDGQNDYTEELKILLLLKLEENPNAKELSR